MTTTVETRLRIELERRVLSRPGPLPQSVIDEIDEIGGDPALLCKHRWNIVRAADLVALLQPWTERAPDDASVITKVAGVRYPLLIGLIDEPWVQVLVDDGTGRLSAWRGLEVDNALVTVVGSIDELDQLALPRTVSEIEILLRRQTALHPQLDWMLAATLGIDINQLAIWLATLATTNKAAFIALTRRDMASGLRLLANSSGHIDASDSHLARSLRNLYEISRLVELMRSMAGPGRSTAESVITAMCDSGLARAHFNNDDPCAHYIADGWMHMQTMHAYRNYAGRQLSSSFPLIGYAQARTTVPIGVEAAIYDSATFDFYASALKSEEIVAGTCRTVLNIEGEQPVDFFCGVELIRLAIVALRAIARKSGHPSALSYANRNLNGRLALSLLREIDPAAFDAYASRWEQTAAVTAAGLTRRDLDRGLTSPYLVPEIGSGFVINTERVRSFVTVTPESAFDPFRWGMSVPLSYWANYHRAATSKIVEQQDDETFRRQILASVTELGTDMQKMFGNDLQVVAEAVAICAEVGAHGTPLARDPKLFSFAIQKASTALARAPGTQRQRLRIVPLSQRKIASLARRARRQAATVSK